MLFWARTFMCLACVGMVITASIALWQTPYTPRTIIGASSGNAMVIVEPRKHHMLKPVVENFDRIMDPSYAMYIFHGKNAGVFAREAAANVTRRKVTLIALDTDNLNPDGYNALLKQPWFYNAIDAENILVFQTDTLLCDASPFKIADFEKYGYIGCPSGHGIGKDMWGPGNSMYGVGGLSFRKKSMVAPCIANEPALPSTPEDVFFSNCVEKGYGTKPETEDVMSAFCTQNVFRRPSMGMHKVDIMLRKDHRAKFLEFCPEARAFF